MKWISVWKNSDVIQTMARYEGQWFINRDRLVLYLIARGRVKPPPEYGLPSKARAYALVFGTPQDLSRAPRR
jgi:hypothetical protein